MIVPLCAVIFRLKRNNYLAKRILLIISKKSTRIVLWVPLYYWDALPNKSVARQRPLRQFRERPRTQVPSPHLFHVVGPKTRSALTRAKSAVVKIPFGESPLRLLTEITALVIVESNGSPRGKVGCKRSCRRAGDCGNRWGSRRNRG